jgi:hypothetical protein
MKKIAPNNQKLPRRRKGKLLTIEAGIIADRALLGIATLLPPQIPGRFCWFCAADRRA